MLSFCVQTAPKIFGGTQQSHLLSFFNGDADDYDTVMDGLKEVAAGFKGKVRRNLVNYHSVCVEMWPCVKKYVALFMCCPVLVLNSLASVPLFICPSLVSQSYVL